VGGLPPTGCSLQMINGGFHKHVSFEIITRDDTPADSMLLRGADREVCRPQDSMLLGGADREVCRPQEPPRLVRRCRNPKRDFDLLSTYYWDNLLCKTGRPQLAVGSVGMNTFLSTIIQETAPQAVSHPGVLSLSQKESTYDDYFSSL